MAQINVYMTQQGTRTIIPATQGENLSRKYDISVIGLDGQPIDLTDCTVIMYVIKGDAVVQIPTTINEKLATVTIPSGACDVPGDHKCYIQVVKSNEYDLRVDNVTLRVMSCNIEGAAEASSEFAALTQLIIDTQTAIANTEEATENANAAAQEARTTATTTATTVATSVAGDLVNNLETSINNQKGVANGFAMLNADGKVTQIPASAGQNGGLATLDSAGKLVQLPTASDLSISDYIIETGTSGDWTYRKWNSGLYECWLYTENTSAVTSVVTKDIAFPISFTSLVSVNVSPVFNAWNISNCYMNQQQNMSEVTTAKLAYAAKTTSSMTYAFSIQIIGKWK